MHSYNQANSKTSNAVCNKTSLHRNVIHLHIKLGLNEFPQHYLKFDNDRKL